jgi:hypothetical protein
VRSRPRAPRSSQRRNNWLRIIGRLKADSNVRQAEMELTTLLSRFNQEILDSQIALVEVASQHERKLQRFEVFVLWKAGTRPKSSAEPARAWAKPRGWLASAPCSGSPRPGASGAS